MYTINSHEKLKYYVWTRVPSTEVIKMWKHLALSPKVSWCWTDMELEVITKTSPLQGMNTLSHEYIIKLWSSPPTENSKMMCTWSKCSSSGTSHYGGFWVIHHATDVQQEDICLHNVQLCFIKKQLNKTNADLCTSCSLSPRSMYLLQTVPSMFTVLNESTTEDQEPVLQQMYIPNSKHSLNGPSYLH